MNLIKYNLLCVLFFLNNTSIAQVNIEPKFYVGQILNHSDKLSHLIKGYCTLSEIAFSTQVKGKKYWEVKRHYPLLGISLFYGTFGNPEILGNAISIIPRMDFSIGKPESKFRIRFGPGIAYLTKRFDLIENPTHTAIGSHLNLTGQLQFFTSFPLKKYISFNTGIGIFHYSNGAWKLPNLGINIYAVNIGISFMKPTEIKYKDPDTVSFIKPPKEIINIRTGIGWKEYRTIGGPRYTQYVISAGTPLINSPINKIYIGTEGFYDKSIFYGITTNGSHEKNPHQKSIRGAGWVGYHFVMSKVSLSWHWGYYFYSPVAARNKLYQRMGVDYQFYKRFYAGFYTKIHFFVIDAFEWSLGIRI